VRKVEKNWGWDGTFPLVERDLGKVKYQTTFNLGKRLAWPTHIPSLSFTNPWTRGSNFGLAGEEVAIRSEALVLDFSSSNTEEAKLTE
tara:strand:- start:433 stop:696 length:264 start_codon:yes stop_codon:yes gene_type:complete